MDFIDALKSIDRLKSFDWNDLFINTDVLNTKISDIKISPERQHSFSIMVKEISNAVAVFQQIDLQKIGEAFINLPDKVKKSAETWAKYGWVPYLPNTPVTDLINLTFPDSQDEADSIMVQNITITGIDELFDTLSEKVELHSHNINTFQEAVKCYRANIFSGCTLLLFAIIDSCFIIGQPESEHRRWLAKKAVEESIDNDKSKIAVFAYTTKLIIEKLFMPADDFNPSIESDLNRNFLSHGMNKHIPSQNDCLKLFVLLYNVYVSFDGKFFSWN